MKNIFINGKFLCQRITGVQRFAIEIVKELDKIEQNDIKFTIIAPEKEYQVNELDLKTIDIVYTKGKPGYYWEQFKLSKYCKKNKPDDLLNLCNIAPIKYPGSCIIYDLAVIDVPKGYSWKQRMVYKFINKKNIKKYHHIYTDSNTMKKRIIDYYKYKNPDNIKVLYAGAEHIENINSKKPNINLPDKYYFSLGSMNPNKNFGAIVNLAKNNPNDFFIISGKSHKSFNEINLENMSNLVFAGYLSDEEIVYLYKNCEAFLFPSIYEGFGIPPLEAIKVGCKKIICNDIPVLKEIYEGMVDFVDFSSIKSINEFNIQKKQEQKDYSWEKSAKKLFESLK